MDANHIIGSSMILFMGYFGNILYSGDLRYHDKILESNSFLFNKDGSVNYPIDELVLDNTFCDPIFDFPTQEEGIEIIKDIIEKNLKINSDLRFFIYCYTVGKEEICLELAKYFKTKIVLEPIRYKMIKKVNFYPDYFTTNPNSGFIHLTKGVNRIDKDTSEENTIHINITGWVNCKTYISIKKKEYLVAYSSHSNYKELKRFVSIVKPAILNKVVIEREGLASIKNVKSLGSYFMWLKNLKQRGFEKLGNFIR